MCRVSNSELFACRADVVLLDVSDTGRLNPACRERVLKEYYAPYKSIRNEIALTGKSFSVGSCKIVEYKGKTLVFYSIKSESKSNSRKRIRDSFKAVAESVMDYFSLSKFSVAIPYEVNCPSFDLDMRKYIESLFSNTECIFCKG